MEAAATADPAGTYSPAFLAARRANHTDKATPAAAFRLARSTFMAGERIDMRELAGTLGVSRTTLYKWCGDRDQLITDILWAGTEDITRWALAAVPAELRGSARLRWILLGYLAAMQRSESLHTYLRQEFQSAVRLITAPGGHDERLAELVASLIETEVTAGHMTPAGRPAILAYAIVRLTESVLYDQALGDDAARYDQAVEVIDLLLGHAR